jgi:hypothetical protein
MKKKYVGVVLASVFLISLVALSSLNVTSVVATSSSGSCLFDAQNALLDCILDVQGSYHEEDWYCCDYSADMDSCDSEYSADVADCNGEYDDACYYDCEGSARHWRDTGYCACAIYPGEGSPTYDDCIDGYDEDYEDDESECYMWCYF